MVGFSHVGLVVSDLERSLRFYQETLGLNCLERHPDQGNGLEIAFVGLDAPVLELLYYTDPAARERVAWGRYDHFAWYVADLRQTMEELRAKGVSFESDQIRQVLDGRQIAFFTGPEGERIELVQPAGR